jgi:hypothetical protein
VNRRTDWWRTNRGDEIGVLLLREVESPKRGVEALFG